MTLTPPRPCVAVVCREAGGRGSVAAVARRHAAELARELDVLLVSDELPESAEPGLRLVQVPRARYGWARRFAHVPRALHFAAAACGLLAERYESAGLDAVICEGHVEAAFAARTLGRSHALPTVLVCHGDIFARPSAAYDPLLTPSTRSRRPSRTASATASWSFRPRWGRGPSGAGRRPTGSG